MEETIKTHSCHKISLLRPTVLFNSLPFPMQEYYFLLTCAYMPFRKRLIDLTEKMPALKIWLPWDTNCAIWCADDINFVKMWLFHCRVTVPCGRVVEVPMLCVLSISSVKQQSVVWLIYLSKLHSTVTCYTNTEEHCVTLSNQYHVSQSCTLLVTVKNAFLLTVIANFQKWGLLGTSQNAF